MSTGNIKTEGNRGNNYPYQSKVLKGLEKALIDLGLLNTSVNSYDRTPNILRETGSGVINAQVYSFSVHNAGIFDGTILGSVIKPGETLNFSAGALNNFYTAGTITYDGTGTELLIIYNS
jgi:hypothetical protein